MNNKFVFKLIEMSLYIAIGLTGSGKSEYTKILNPDITICRDSIFESYRNRGMSLKKSKIATHNQIVNSIQNIKPDEKCYYDSNNLTSDVRLFFVDLAKSNNLKVFYVVFEIERSLLIQRIINRKDHPTQKLKSDDEKIKILDLMISQYKPPNDDELSLLDGAIYIY